MKASDADQLGQQIAILVAAQHPDRAYAALQPFLTQRISFAILDRIGALVGAGPVPLVNELLDRVAVGQAMGGWPIIGKALNQQFSRDPAGALARCRQYIVTGDVWYATDILGERLHGPALVVEFDQTLSLLAGWRTHNNRWVRRSVGVGVHVWAKRAHGQPELAPQASRLFEFLEPMFAELEMDVVKGVGWGLKTLGRYYPGLAADWLTRQVVQQPHYRALMLRKALTYLPKAQCQRVKRASRA